MCVSRCLHRLICAAAGRGEGNFALVSARVFAAPRQKIKQLFALINQDAALQKWMDQYRQLMGGSSSET